MGDGSSGASAGSITAGSRDGNVPGENSLTRSQHPPLSILSSSRRDPALVLGGQFWGQDTKRVTHGQGEETGTRGRTGSPWWVTPLRGLAPVPGFAPGPESVVGHLSKLNLPFQRACFAKVTGSSLCLQFPPCHWGPNPYGTTWKIPLRMQTQRGTG